MHGEMRQRTQGVALKFDFVGSAFPQVSELECVVNMLQVHVFLHCEPDYQHEHGGMKFVEMAESGTADKAGFRSGDVLIEYGGRKIDSAVDNDRLRYVYYEGEKVMVTVIRGHEKITKEGTLEEMR